MSKLTKLVATLAAWAGLLSASTFAMAATSPVKTGQSAGIPITFTGYGPNGVALCDGPLGPGACQDIVTWLQRAGPQSQPEPSQPTCKGSWRFIRDNFPICLENPMPNEPFSCLAPNSPEAGAYCDELSRKAGIVF